MLLHDVVADRVLGILLLFDVDDGGAQVVHLRLFLRPHQLDAVIDDAVVFLGADDEVEMGHFLEELFASALRHAAHHSEDEIRLRLPMLAELAHVAEGLLLGLVSHRAGIQQHHIGLIGLGRDREATLDEHLRDLLGVALVHLATKGSEIDFRHRERGNLAGKWRETSLGCLP